MNADGLPSVRVIRDGLPGFHADVHGEWWKTGRPNLDAVRTRGKIQMLEGTVEVIDDPDVVPVGEHLRVFRGAFDAQSSVRGTGRRHEVPGRWRRIAVVVVVIAVRVV